MDLGRAIRMEGIVKDLFSVVCRINTNTQIAQELAIIKQSFEAIIELEVEDNGKKNIPIDRGTIASDTKKEITSNTEEKTGRVRHKK